MAIALFRAGQPGFRTFSNYIKIYTVAITAVLDVTCEKANKQTVCLKDLQFDGFQLFSNSVWNKSWT